MKCTHACIALAAALTLALSAAYAGIEKQTVQPTYEVTRKFAIGGDAQWDYVTVDSANHRLYIAQGSRIAVVDAADGKLVGEVAGLSGAHGIALVPDAGKGFATSGKDGNVVVFDLKTFKPITKIKTGEKPDAIVYDLVSKRVFVCNGKVGPITVLDPANLDAKPETIDVAGKLEFAVVDGKGHLYVNVEDKNELVAINTETRKVEAHWPLAPGEEPTGLALDAARRRLYVGCGNKKMIILDADHGTVVATAPIGEGVDGVACDAGAITVTWDEPGAGDTMMDSEPLALAANGKDGTATVVNATGKVVQTVATLKGARTIALDGHTAYLPAMVEKDGKKTFGIVVIAQKAMPEK